MRLGRLARSKKHQQRNTTMSPNRILPGGRLSPQEVPEVNKQFHRETQQFNFHYRCADCEHFNREKSECSMRYPRVERDGLIHQCRTEDGALLFCKYFELDGSTGGISQ